jgi:hypothetical protein
MPSNRQVLRFPDGENEWRLPASPLSVGDRVGRRLREWVVVSVDEKDPDLTVVILRAASAEQPVSEAL